MDFDYHVNLMCFPRLCGLDVPAPQAKKERGKGVGVCWFGSPTHKADKLRSVPIERFAPLAEAIDDTLLSLGWGFFWKLENNVAVGDNKPDFVEYCLNERQDWLQTAEFVKGLELVITVDTAIAHLAGFLGVECWLLLPYVPDFRWGMKGETTPWYHSMRLYRQPKLMDWDSVFERVRSDLEKRFAPSLEAQAA
jgi:ADP-heptose:LPS heptosyltransferase